LLFAILKLDLVLYCRDVASDLQAWGSTSRLDHELKYSGQGGPKSLAFDLARSQRWALLAHAGSYTGMHHDSNGFGTWVEVKYGGKVWNWTRFQPGERSEVIKQLKNAFEDGDTASYGNYTTILREGDLL
jgi:hypothetical protein